jgi:hypothetical protein
MTPSGLEPATFQIVELCLDQLRHRVYHDGVYTKLNIQRKVRGSSSHTEEGPALVEYETVSTTFLPTPLRSSLVTGQTLKCSNLLRNGKNSLPNNAVSYPRIPENSLLQNLLSEKQYKFFFSKTNSTTRFKSHTIINNWQWLCSFKTCLVNRKHMQGLLSIRLQSYTLVFKVSNEHFKKPSGNYVNHMA